MTVQTLHPTPTPNLPHTVPAPAAAPAPVQAPAPAPAAASAPAKPQTAAFPELDTQGYTVVRGVLAPEKAAHYAAEMYAWLESFGLGFKGDDRGTWHPSGVPAFDKGGLFHRYGVQHEQFVWDIRSEAGVVDAFARLWGTPELLVSYDSINISLPFASELPAAATAPWPHVDQSPTRTWRHCVQGIVNLAENGEHDGGLMVLRGSTALFAEYFAAHPDVRPPEGWPTADWWGHTAGAVEWFEARGCVWEKVCAAPGDLILWDSRTVHYGAAAAGTRPRLAAYVCYKPAKDATREQVERKRECFEKSWGTTHDPLDFRITAAKFKPHWDVKPGERTMPRAPPVLSHRGRQLAGLEPY